MSWLLGFFGKAKLYLIAAGAFMAALGAAWMRARQDGKNAARLEQAEAKARLQEEYDAIDHAPADVDAAYERLGRMSDDKRRR